MNNDAMGPRDDPLTLEGAPQPMPIGTPEAIVMCVGCGVVYVLAEHRVSCPVCTGVGAIKIEDLFKEVSSARSVVEKGGEERGETVGGEEKPPRRQRRRGRGDATPGGGGQEPCPTPPLDKEGAPERPGEGAEGASGDSGAEGEGGAGRSGDLRAE